MLKEQKYCSVSMIANTLYVAPITVRRDLAEMEFMDASSTVLHIADYLQTKQNITVITNDDATEEPN